MTFDEWYYTLGDEVSFDDYGLTIPVDIAKAAWNKASELKQGEITILQAQIATLQETVAAAQMALAGAPTWAQGHRDAIALLKKLSEQEYISEILSEQKPTG